MSEATANGHGSATTVDGANGGSFEVMPEIAPPGLVRRYFTTQRHFWGLLLGAYVARVRHQRSLGRRGARFLLQRLLAAVLRRVRQANAGGSAVPGPAPAAAGDARADLHQARPDPRAALGPPARRGHRRAEEPARPAPRGALRTLHEDRGRGRRPAGRGDVLLGRPDAPRLGVDRPDPPRHHDRRRGRHPQGGQAGDPRDAATRLPAPAPARRGAAARCRCASSRSR